MGRKVQEVVFAAFLYQATPGDIRTQRLNQPVFATLHAIFDLTRNRQNSYTFYFPPPKK
jgi:hypothetical protein